jgi:hypothetical protein
MQAARVRFSNDPSGRAPTNFSQCGLESPCSLSLDLFVLRLPVNQLHAQVAHYEGFSCNSALRIAFGTVAGSIIDVRAWSGTRISVLLFSFWWDFLFQFLSNSRILHATVTNELNEQKTKQVHFRNLQLLDDHARREARKTS